MWLLERDAQCVVSNAPFDQTIPFKVVLQRHDIWRIQRDWEGAWSGDANFGGPNEKGILFRPRFLSRKRWQRYSLKNEQRWGSLHPSPNPISLLSDGLEKLQEYACRQNWRSFAIQVPHKSVKIRFRVLAAQNWLITLGDRGEHSWCVPRKRKGYHHFQLCSVKSFQEHARIAWISDGHPPTQCCNHKAATFPYDDWKRIHAQKVWLLELAVGVLQGKATWGRLFQTGPRRGIVYGLQQNEEHLQVDKRACHVQRARPSWSYQGMWRN